MLYVLPTVRRRLPSMQRAGPSFSAPFFRFHTSSAFSACARVTNIDAEGGTSPAVNRSSSSLTRGSMYGVPIHGRCSCMRGRARDDGRICSPYSSRGASGLASAGRTSSLKDASRSRSAFATSDGSRRCGNSASFLRANSATAGRSSGFTSVSRLAFPWTLTAVTTWSLSGYASRSFTKSALTSECVKVGGAGGAPVFAKAIRSARSCAAIAVSIASRVAR